MIKAGFTEFFRLFAMVPHNKAKSRRQRRRWDRAPRSWRRVVHRRRLVREPRMAVSLTDPILIVDDYNTMIRILRNLLRQLGFTHIDEASDGRTALTKLGAKNYQLVISDWDMAPMNGLELLRQVRGVERYRETPVVMVTKEAAAAQIADRAGASSYLVKPFSAQTLKTKLVGVMGAF
jgi:two-component system chemotaxis response regulator CheY